MNVKSWRVVYAYGDGPPKTELFAREHEARLRFQAVMRMNRDTNTSPRLKLLRTEALEADGWRSVSTLKTETSTRATGGVSPSDRRKWAAQHMYADPIYRLPAARRRWVAQRSALLRTPRRRGSSTAVRR